VVTGVGDSKRTFSFKMAMNKIAAHSELHTCISLYRNWQHFFQIPLATFIARPCR